MTLKWGVPFLAISLVAACVDDVDTNVDTSEASSCKTSSSVYTPYDGYSPSGDVASLPWRNEDFDGYALPSAIECSSSKSRRAHLDVTAGCLNAVAIGEWTRGQIVSTTGGAFRALALGYDADSDAPVKWTDQSIEYRFHYAGTSGAGVDPGFKAFLRYRTENDLYVASWRVDGYVQIKKKICGAYTTLAQVKRRGPTTGEWHKIRFDAIGDELTLYLDGERVLSATDRTLSWGTAGIRTDAMTGAYLDDWRVQMP